MTTHGTGWVRLDYDFGVSYCRAVVSCRHRPFADRLREDLRMIGDPKRDPAECARDIEYLFALDWPALKGCQVMSMATNLYRGQYEFMLFHPSMPRTRTEGQPPVTLDLTNGHVLGPLTPRQADEWVEWLGQAGIKPGTCVPDNADEPTIMVYEVPVRPDQPVTADQYMMRTFNEVRNTHKG